MSPWISFQAISTGESMHCFAGVISWRNQFFLLMVYSLTFSCIMVLATNLYYSDSIILLIVIKKTEYTDLSYLSCKHYTTRFYHGDIIFLIANQEVRTYWLVVFNRFSLFLNMAPESNLYYSAYIVFLIPH